MIVHVKAVPPAVEYPIYFTSDVFAPENTLLSTAVRRRDPASRHRIAVVLDRGVIAASREIILHIERYAAHHHAYLELVAPPIVLDGGETLKDDALLISRLQSYFHALELDRRSVLLVVGGASLLDLTGFASATMRSAPRVIRLPTTTLAQSGPAVLPASSINAFGTKDFLGTQRPPFAVLCDRRFPDTQRPRDKVAGLTQAVRAALLWDEGLLGWISAHAGRLGAGDRDTVAELVQKSAGLYASHAATLGAEDEDAASEALSYGTWSADRLALLADLRIRSGEALAIGIALDTVVSSLAGLIGGKERDLVVGTLERLGLRLWHDALGRADSEGRPLLLDGLAELCGGLAPRVPLLAGVGEGAVAHALRESVVREAIEWLSRRDAHRTCAWALA